jgi:RNA polymerase-binding transcription factor DksA
MRAETVARISEALRRLDAGDYGICRGCGAEIAGRRLRALPFAVRCRTCEEQIEREVARAERPASGSQHEPLFPELAEV